MYYAMHVLQSALIWPWRIANSQALTFLDNSSNPFQNSVANRVLVASGQLFEQVTKRHGRPRFGTFHLDIDGSSVQFCPKVVKAEKFCNLLHFERPQPTKRKRPCVLVVAPMAGHFATLLRGTVERLLPWVDVYITEWRDAREVPLRDGDFGFFDYVDYLREFIHFLAPDIHVIAVCQPTVPAYALASWMETVDDPLRPKSLTLVGGPVDVEKNPTAVNRAACAHDISWFAEKIIDVVPFPFPGMGRRVYPGFMQLTNFMSMNVDRHISAHLKIFQSLVVGDEESAVRRSSFYEEYRTVMDLTESFFLQTLQYVFQERRLPRGILEYQGVPIRPADIRRIPLLCIEGERDDICGVGQTEAALQMATGLPEQHRRYLLQRGVGHYGLFNGRRFSRDIAPQILGFIDHYDRHPLIP